MSGFWEVPMGDAEGVRKLLRLHDVLVTPALAPVCGDRARAGSEHVVRIEVSDCFDRTASRTALKDALRRCQESGGGWPACSRVVCVSNFMMKVTSDRIGKREWAACAALERSDALITVDACDVARPGGVRTRTLEAFFRRQAKPAEHGDVGREPRSEKGEGEGEEETDSGEAGGGEAGGGGPKAT